MGSSAPPTTSRGEARIGFREQRPYYLSGRSLDRVREAALPPPNLSEPSCGIAHAELAQASKNAVKLASGKQSS